MGGHQGGAPGQELKRRDAGVWSWVVYAWLTGVVDPEEGADDDGCAHPDPRVNPVMREAGA